MPATAPHIRALLRRMSSTSFLLPVQEPSTRAPMRFLASTPPAKPATTATRTTTTTTAQPKPQVPPTAVPSTTATVKTNGTNGAPNSHVTSPDISATGLADHPQQQQQQIPGSPETPSPTSASASAPDASSLSNASPDWTTSYHGLSAQPFSADAAAILLQPTDPEDVEIKPDGIIYVPEIKYRRILNRAFGPGGWGLVPRGESIITPKLVTREYALVAHGRLVSIARGEQPYFSPDSIPTATEGCKSNGMMRCCKDLGVASELWDPRWIRAWKATHAREAWVEHVVTKKKNRIWVRKGDPVGYPWKETS